MFENYPDIVNVEDLMEMLQIGKSSAYSLLQSSRIKHVRVGKRYIIPKKSVVSFLEEPCYNEGQIVDGRLLISKGASL